MQLDKTWSPVDVGNADKASSRTRSVRVRYDERQSSGGSGTKAAKRCPVATQSVEPERQKCLDKNADLHRGLSRGEECTLMNDWQLDDQLFVVDVTTYAFESIQVNNGNLRRALSTLSWTEPGAGGATFERGDQEQQRVRPVRSSGRRGGRSRKGWGTTQPKKVKVLVHDHPRDKIEVRTILEPHQGFFPADAHQDSAEMGGQRVEQAAKLVETKTKMYSTMVDPAGEILSVLCPWTRMGRISRRRRAGAEKQGAEEERQDS
ncbi:hypothetical protein DFH06DRAFT_1144556, partial [Mycena polygramma]